MSAGSLRRVSIRGIDFDLLADTDIDSKVAVNVEGVATSGPTMYKTVFQVPEATGFKIVYTKENLTLIDSYIKDGQNSEIFYTDIDGDDYYCTGRIRRESSSSANGEINITVIPLRDWE